MYLYKYNKYYLFNKFQYKITRLMKLSSKPRLKLMIQSPLNRQKLISETSYFSTTNNQLLNNQLPPPETTSEIQSPIKKIQSFLQKSEQLIAVQQQQIQKQDAKFNIKNKLQKDSHSQVEFQNNFYKRALQYSRQRKIQNDFNKQFKIRKRQKSTRRSTSLNQFLRQKDGNILIQKNIRNRNQNITEEFLKDNNFRNIALQKAILLQRFYYLDKNKKKQQEIIRSTNYLPKRFKGLNPKHMRLKTHAYNYQAYKRQKYLETKSTFQYLQKAIKTQNQAIDNKIKQNSDLINLIVDLNSRNTQSSTDYTKQTILIKRLFLKYTNMSSQDPQQLYKYISFNSLIQICQDLSIQIQRSKIQKIYENHQPITILKFYDVLNRFSQQLYGTSHNLISNITRNKIEPSKLKFFHQIWIALQQDSENIRKLFDPSKKLYKKVISNFQKELQRYDKSYRLNYLNCFQFIWRLKIFPRYITKSKIRYFYEYSSVQLEGLKAQQFIEFICAVGLYINKQDTKSTAERIKYFISKYIEDQ